MPAGQPASGGWTVLVAADVEALVDHAMTTYGRLDVAFNNAGIEGDVRPLVEQTEANYDAVMDINVKGVWLSMKYEIIIREISNLLPEEIDLLVYA
jgi:NAD(P)-dependent dehydrogenase (short-subunit alcohol dehydrogenase family)